MHFDTARTACLDIQTSKHACLDIQTRVFGNQLEKAIHNFNKALLLLLFAVYIYVYSAIQKRDKQFHARNEVDSDHRSY